MMTTNKVEGSTLLQMVLSSSHMAEKENSPKGSYQTESDLKILYQYLIEPEERRRASLNQLKRDSDQLKQMFSAREKNSSVEVDQGDASPINSSTAAAEDEPNNQLEAESVEYEFDKLELVLFKMVEQQSDGFVDAEQNSSEPALEPASEPVTAENSPLPMEALTETITETMTNFEDTGSEETANRVIGSTESSAQPSIKHLALKIVPNCYGIGRLSSDYGMRSMRYRCDANLQLESQVLNVLLPQPQPPKPPDQSHGNRDSDNYLCSAFLDFEDDDDESVEVFKRDMMNRAIHAAARGGKWEILKQLFGNAFDILAFRNSQGCTVLHAAAGRGQFEVVRNLLASCDIINMIDSQGNTALHVASYRGYLPVVEILILESPSLALLTNHHGDTFLHMAVAGFKSPGFRRLDKRTELMKQLVSEKIVKQLVSEKIVKLHDIINTRNNDGRTTLHVSVIDNNIQCELVELLISVASIDLNIKDSDGMTPLDILKHRPKSASSEILIKRLISAGGSSSHQDYSERKNNYSLFTNVKTHGIGSSSGTPFRIPDFEIFMYTSIEDDGKHANYDKVSMESNSSSDEISNAFSVLSCNPKVWDPGGRNFDHIGYGILAERTTNKNLCNLDRVLIRGREKIIIALRFCAIIYLTIGLFGYFLFDDSIQSDILINFDQNTGSAVGFLHNSLVNVQNCLFLLEPCWFLHDISYVLANCCSYIVEMQHANYVMVDIIMNHLEAQDISKVNMLIKPCFIAPDGTSLLYHDLEDKVIFYGGGNVMISNSTRSNLQKINESLQRPTLGRKEGARHTIQLYKPTCVEGMGVKNLEEVSLSLVPPSSPLYYILLLLHLSILLFHFLIFLSSD